MTNDTSIEQKKIRHALFFIAILTAVFIITVHSLQAKGTTFFVGGTGASDSNPGTASHPFATIQKAANVAMAGDVVNIRAYIYRETIIPSNSGEPGNPIIFQPDGEAIVTVSGADPTEGNWSVHNGNIYKKTISMTNGYNTKMTDNTTLMANHVFVNGKMMIEARWPNLANSDDLFNRADFQDALPSLTDRLPLKAMIHDEIYSDYSKEQIDQLYQEKEKLSISKQFVAENNRTNLAQVFMDVRYKKQDNESFSEKLLETIRGQGFKI